MPTVFFTRVVYRHNSLREEDLKCCVWRKSRCALSQMATGCKPLVMLPLAMGGQREEWCFCLPTPSCRSHQMFVEPFSSLLEPFSSLLIALETLSWITSPAWAVLTSISEERNGKSYWAVLKAPLCFSLDPFPVWFICINRQVTFFLFLCWWSCVCHHNISLKS